MLDIKEVISSLKEKEKFCIEYYEPEWILADEVVRELSGFSTSEYNIFDIFSNDIIDKYILSPGKDYIYAGMIGGRVESFIKADSSDLKKIDHSDLIFLFQKVFGEWEKAGWISIEKSSNLADELPISIKISPRRAHL